MKPIYIMMLLASTSFAVAQGTVNFANDNSSLIRLSQFTGLPSEPLQGGGYAQLFWAPSNYPSPTPLTQGMAPIAWVAENAGWSLAGLPAGIGAMIGTTPGLFNGGTVTIPSKSPGDSIQAVVLAWYNAPNFGGSIDYAVSAPFLIQLGDPSGTAGSITGPGKFGGLTITQIPEPSAVGMVGLGLLLLMYPRSLRLSDIAR